MSNLAIREILATVRPASLCGGNMIRLDLSYFYRLSTTLGKLRNLPDGQRSIDIWIDLYGAHSSIKEIYSNSILMGHLRSSGIPGKGLATALEGVMNMKAEAAVDSWQLAAIVRSLDAFEAALLSEMAVADAYLVTDKAPYSTVHLATRGADLFPKEVSAKVPEALDDLDAAGKCLAFELATACGFHTMRAMEAVLRRYWTAVTGTAPHPKHRNLGVYLRKLKEIGCGDDKIIAALTQIKDLHRNEISHPDATLTVEEAISLVGMARSAVAAMLAVIPDQTFELTAPPSDSAVPGQ